MSDGKKKEFTKPLLLLSVFFFVFFTKLSVNSYDGNKSFQCLLMASRRDLLDLHLGKKWAATNTEISPQAW